jgi:hypothetical protein
MISQQINFLELNPLLHALLNGHDGNSFMSIDAQGHLCSVTGALLRLNSRYFDGVDDYIDVESPLSAAGGSVSKTLIVWASPDKVNFSTPGRIMTLHRTAENTAFSIYAEGNPATWKALYSTGGTGYNIIDSGISLVAGQPFFLALVQDGSIILFYIDDITVTASNGSTPEMYNPANACIGAFYNGGIPGQFFKGNIGEAYVFSKALTPLEIQRIRLTTEWRYR